MIATHEKIRIEPIKESRLDQYKNSPLIFGRVFSDHMFVADYENGAWSSYRIVPYDNISLQPSCLVFHYGQAIFEGMKAYKTSENKVLLFRPEDNIERFNKSAIRMCMPTFNEEDFLEALKELVKIDEKWIPEGENKSLYIRPFMIATDEYLGVKPSEKYRFIIITSPVGSYYSEPVKVKIETHYTRAVEGGTGFAKSAGNYAGSLYPTKLAHEQGYQQLLWTDAQEHKYFEESGTMNVMFYFKDKGLVTPNLSNTILNGVTRSTVLDVARKWGITVTERRVSVDEVIEGLKNGNLLEAFGTGTAATIASISHIKYENTEFTLPTLDANSFSKKVVKYLDELRRGVIADEFGWTVKVD